MYPDPSGRDWNATISNILTLEDVPNKGPLTAIYTALFSNNSFLDAWSDPDYRTYVSNALSYSRRRYIAINLCEDVLPMGPIIEAVRDDYSSWKSNVCLDTRRADAEMVGVTWLTNFAEVDTMRAAFRMAAFMANEITLLKPIPGTMRPGYSINIDMGVDVAAPVMPLAGIIVGSILLGLFLLLLIALALFAASTPHWTDRLDAYATLKMGAAMALSTEGLAKVGSGAENALDRAPGFVGDAMPESEVGRLAVGAEGPLRRRRYEASVCGVIPE
ncbi:hypothetical protein DIS24_g9577 [Lasiodiplodia hormozganensis]|uniref:Uncharacterized protein n=1 Tax=Lasiodiplodia hormozganensis TaxID=869390 RepID=A0AA40CJ29_9PEZI|nr:hypothetical protein DIS24_g9577 [Lasiodiplodia hormozganensis]